MPDFEKMYFHLFGVVADAIDALEREEPDIALMYLIKAQHVTEEKYISE